LQGEKYYSTIDNEAMAKRTKEEMTLINKDINELLKLILKKDGMSYRRFLDISKREFIVSNLDMVTPEEREQFKHIVI
jgi:hypothetical protein